MPFQSSGVEDTRAWAGSSSVEERFGAVCAYERVAFEGTWLLER